MTPPRGWQRLLPQCLLAALLCSSAGCMTFFNPVHHPGEELIEPCKNLPLACRSHVYVFIVNGLDPCDWSNLSGLRDYLNSLGFNKVYLGELYHTWQFDKELHKIREEDPEARFVLIGFSFGANIARNLAQSAAKDDIAIDLLVYLGGNTMKNVPDDRPENCLQIVNILAAGGFWWNGDTLDGAENMEVDGCWHFGSPTHGYTLGCLARELATVASHVPVVVKQMPKSPYEEEAPTPRPVQTEPTAERDEWDFLKPVERLNPPAPRDVTASGTTLQVSHKPGEEAGRPLWVRGEIAPRKLSH
ncbi:MAG: hypothetical protein K2R98_19985 [Gemmataceae bacterium]|nr:hypothetical protein [Gemmataceae bacterium]